MQDNIQLTKHYFATYPLITVSIFTNWHCIVTFRNIKRTPLGSWPTAVCRTSESVLHVHNCLFCFHSCADVAASNAQLDVHYSDDINSSLYNKHTETLKRCYE